jgi:serine/threonine-protein kinase
MRAGFWKSDWFLGVVVVFAVVLFARLSDLIPSLERKAYDMGVTATSRAPGADPSVRAGGGAAASVDIGL